MANIKDYIRNNLLVPLKQYPTVIQETMVEYIIELLETLYNYTLIFPEIVSPNIDRLDILKVIADQFIFTIRDDADLQEQIDILRNILIVYSKRGSIDTIENMWKYYGGDLPKEVEVIIPSANIFRYNISTYSGNQVYQDGDMNRTGVYEIQLTNSTYPIPELKEFLLKELVAAGNYIYFSNVIRLDLLKDVSPLPYKYDVMEEIFLKLEMTVAHSYQGLYLSGPNSVSLSGGLDLSNARSRAIDNYDLLNPPVIDGLWSGKENIFIDICNIIETEVHDYYYDVAAQYFEFDIQNRIKYDQIVKTNTELIIEAKSYCTPSTETTYINHDLYNDKGEHVIAKEYFILGESLLGESLGYELASEEII